MRSRSFALASSLAAIALAAACRDGTDGRDGADGEPCTVSSQPDGGALITCPDGSTARIPAGARGDDGYATLVVIAPESPGDNCELGGARVVSGIDKDRDDALDESEINSTVFVCDGAAGADGDDAAAVLASVRVLEAGDECERGGQHIIAGTDEDGDGVLDAEEVTVDLVVCHDDQHAALTRVSAEAPGDSCEAGGVRVESGLDLDDDGELDVGEIDTTDIVCHGGFGPWLCVEPSDFAGFPLAYVDGTPFDDPTLAIVSTATFLLEPIAAVSPPLSLGGLAYDHASGLIFATTRGETPPRLGTITLDGAFTAIGAISAGIETNITALAIEPLTGTLLAVEETYQGEHRLLELSRATGAGTVVDAIGTAPHGDGWDAMAVGPDCRVYAAAGTFLYAVDPVTRAVDQIADLGVVLDALIYDGTTQRWLGFWIYEGGEFVSFEHGTFAAATVGPQGNGFEVRAMTKHPAP